MTVWVEAARRVLQTSGRPLSLRKILSLGLRDGLFGDHAPDLDALRGALDAAGASEIRRGVFAWIETAPASHAVDDDEAPEDDEADDDDVLDDVLDDDLESLDDDGGRRRRRRRRTSDLIAGEPASATTLEEAVAMSARSPDGAHLRTRLWDRLRARAAAVLDDDAGGAGGPSRAPREVPPPAGPASGPPRPTPRQEGREARPPRSGDLGDRGRARPAVRPGEGEPSPVETVTAAAATTTESPYVERRQATAPPPEPERRVPSVESPSPPDALVEQALAVLRSRGRPMPLPPLVAALHGPSPLDPRRVRAALLAENARRSGEGSRAPFVVYFDGSVGLTDWALADRYRHLEATVEAALAEQRELVRRDLLTRVASLGDAAFEQVVVLLLEQVGYSAVRVVYRQAGGSLALLATYDDGGVAVDTALVARRAWTTIGRDTVRALRDGLGSFGAQRGVLLTVGTFGPDAREEASRPDRASLVLVDGAGLARLLYDHGIGLVSARPVVRYVDAAFFESLE